MAEICVGPTDVHSELRYPAGGLKNIAAEVASISSRLIRQIRSNWLKCRRIVARRSPNYALIRGTYKRLKRVMSDHGQTL